ncbi:MAG: spore maturation protein [Bdellovibrionales bacterium]|nr:spore maturation protein [Bdellovibrionales bacterium]
MAEVSSDSAAKPSPINLIFVLFIVSAIVFAACNNSMKAVTDASFDSAKGAVTLALNLIGIMSLWLGLVRILEAGGLLYTLARWMRPLMCRLFPEVPADHPAMGAMLLNMSANMLGLGNAATPFGIKAMIELNKLSTAPGTATNAMCLFLAINTSSITILPLGVIGVRAAAGSSDPAGIFLTTLVATCCSTLVAILTAKLLSRSSEDPSMMTSEVRDSETASDEYEHLRMPVAWFHQVLAWGSLLVFFSAAAFHTLHAPSKIEFLTKDFVSYWLMPFLMLLIIFYGLLRGVKMYEAVTEGAKQGFDIAIKIIPYLVAILVAIAMFRASGAMEALAYFVNPITGLIAMPAEVLPLALVRPLSGSGAFGVMSSLVSAAPDSYASFLASTMMGSTETTFYVLAVYFGAIGVHKVRHALWAALTADIAGIVSACLVCNLMWVSVV